MSTKCTAEVIVLGAGFSGLCAAIDLERSGRSSFLVLEKSGDLGGTWRDNSYPGVECDVPSHLYSLSFAPSAEWSKWYAGGQEILSYLHACVDRFGIRDRIVFNACAEEARWTGDEWRIATSEGEEYLSRFVIAGLGGLHIPKIPSFVGAEEFAGPMFHTSQWRHDIDLSGKRVGMIGTGATAVQAAPAVAEIAEEFHLFQRSPVWVGPKPDPGYSAQQRAELHANPEALRRLRWDLWEKWETNGLDLYRAGTAVNRTVEAAALDNIRMNVWDPDLVEKLVPNYNITCKRPTLSNRYYPMFNRKNVHLEVDPIERLTSAGVVVEPHREIPLDVVVLATGFKAFNITNEIDIVGIGGLHLADAWDERVAAYRSIMVPEFPNLFVLMGPNSSGVTSALQMIEAGSKFALRAIEYVESHREIGIHPLQTQVDEFIHLVDDLTAKTPLNQGCNSWWTDGGTNHAMFPESSVTFRMMLNDFQSTHFHHLVA